MTLTRQFLGALLAAPLAGALAADAVPKTPPQGPDKNPDWPCEQALVPEISAAVVWDGPPVDKLRHAWRDTPAVAALVAQVSSPGFNEQGAQSAIAAFAASQQPGDRDRMLTMLFAGVLETLNEDRHMLINGIERYSRDQQRRAQTLGDQLDQMVRLEQDPSPAARQQLQDLKRHLELEQRVFDEREKSIRYLCLRPVAVEQRLGFLARTIAGHLD